MTKNQVKVRELIQNGNNNLPPELGGGKERSVTYESYLIKTPEELDKILNQDKYAFSYIYWIPQAVGCIISICKPNPKAFIEKYTKKIQRGLLELSESDATKQTIDHFPVDPSYKEIIAVIFARLYENGYVLARKVDEAKIQ